MSQNQLAADRMKVVLQEVADRRRRDRMQSVCAVVGVLCAALLACLVVVALCDPANAVENVVALLKTLAYVVLLPLLIVGGMLYGMLDEGMLGQTVFGMIGILTALAMLFIPVFLYLRSQVGVMRRRTILSLLQTAMETGVPPAEMIRVYASVCFGEHRNLLMGLAQSLENGRSLPTVLAAEPKLARYDVCGILALGKDEKRTLETLDEMSRDSRSRVLTQTNGIFRIAYLLAICGPMFGVVVFIQLHLVKQFEAIFDDFGVALPPLTRAVFDFGMPFAMMVAMFLPFTAVCLFVYLMMQSDTIASRPPGLRRLFRNVDASRFLRIFNTGLKNDVPIPDGIDMYRRVAASSHLKDVAERINRTIRSGGDWIEAFRTSRMITTSESRLLESARRTANLAAVIDQIAESKDLRQTAMSDTVSKFVFIPTLLVIGALVGVFVVGMFLPMVTLIQALV